MNAYEIDSSYFNIPFYHDLPSLLAAEGMHAKFYGAMNFLELMYKVYLQ